MTASKLGCPRILKLKKPLPAKDLDSTVSYEQFTTDECPTDSGEYDDVMDFQFTICEPAENNADLKASHSPPPPPLPPPSSSDMEFNDSDDGIWDCPYVNYCHQQLRNNQLVRNLVDKLHTAYCLQDFMLLVTQITDGQLSPLNIAFLLCLE